MNCQKEFTIQIVSCIGLAANAVWTYNPSTNPGQPPASVLLEYDFEGYYGQWAAQRSGGPISPTTIEWRVDWASVAGRTLRVRSTLVGNVTRFGSGATVICRSNANGNIVSNSQLCAAGVTTPVNLEAIALDATLGGAAFVDINHQIPSDQTYSLSGVVEVSCFDP